MRLTQKAQKVWLTCFLLLLSLLQGMTMAETKISTLDLPHPPPTLDKPYKKMAPKFFAFTPESNGGHRIAILVNYDKAKNTMRSEGSNEDYIQKKLRGTVTIYKQASNKNRPELISKLDIQDFKMASGGYFATLEPTTMLLHSFEVKDIDEKYFDREYYSIYVELESTEDLDDIGILVHKGHKPPII